MSALSGVRSLHQLARFHGVQLAYYDVDHHRRQASEESLLAILRSLGAPVASFQDVPLVLRERQQELWQQVIEPVVVAWNGEPFPMEVRLPLRAASTTLSYYLKLETGEEMRYEWRGADQKVLETTEVEGEKYVVKHLPLPGWLPWGYHRLTLDLPGGHEESLVISAPLGAYIPPEKTTDRRLGVFLPLYALHTRRSWGSGDFSDLGGLIDRVGEMGGQVVATLPLLATFIDRDREISPYLPASRLFWNEFYLDINAVSELKECHTARALLESSSFQNEIEALRGSALVDYQREMVLKRRVLEELTRCLFDVESKRLEGLRRFTKANPVIDDYARFRAAGEKYGTSWKSWPQSLREGTLREGDYDEANRRYHLYVQWLAYQQMENVSRKAKEKGVQLYLDLPVGVSPDGYDVWREGEAFVLDTSAGAPPDAVFTRGQNWEFPPLHPGRIRKRGYRYMVAYLRHHLQQAAILRIDHVMGLHRIFCIPDGMEASQGVYLRYRAEELYAILALESHRHQAIIVGEDLGTVPPYVRPAMKRHGLHRMYVVHYELASDPRKGLSPVPHNSVASLNTHDMHPFAAFWESSDINERLELGLLDRKGAREERRTRQDILKTLSTFLRRKAWLREAGKDTFSALKACLSFLAASRARIVLVNLEDLWLETEPQNVPSTRKEHPNWQRKTRYSLEEFCQLPQVVDTLMSINELRKQSKHIR